MTPKVSKRLNFDDIDQSPLLSEGSLGQGLSRLERKRRRGSAGHQDYEYRKRRQSVCSESDSSVDGFNTDDNSEEEKEFAFQMSSPLKEIFHELSLPIKQISLEDISSLSDFVPNRKKPKHSNINPFSPSSLKRKRHLSQSEDLLCSENEEFYKSASPKQEHLSLCEMSIKRYESEFLELEKLASGNFGQVMLARHRLDGVEYAVKISEKQLKLRSHEEKKALNEVFAHATLNNHKHVVTYYNSWVEDGQVYIQNEFCQGGSLSKKIEERRISGENFSEDELKRILNHSLKGLQYIHSNNLVHLDIKPENIFISLKQEEDETCDYKIGDLGHIVRIHGGDISPEEGDCRYMAPEFLESKLDHSLLTKADMFSLGLTLYEAASLRSLPKNSSEDSSYQTIKKGHLPYLNNYSIQFNTLLQTMVHPSPCFRPSTSELLSDSHLNPAIAQTKAQLYMELKETKEKLQTLQMQLYDANDVQYRREN